MELIEEVANQVACYWKPTGETDDFGDDVYEEPVELAVYWMDKSQLFTNARGEEKLSRSLVYTLEDVELDGVLWQGELEDLPAGDRTKPFSLGIEKAFKIQRFDKIPSFDGDEWVRTAYL